MTLYGYDMSTWTKFSVDAEEVCYRINSDQCCCGDQDYYIYTTETDRDLHFDDNKKIEEEQKNER